MWHSVLYSHESYNSENDLKNYALAWTLLTWPIRSKHTLKDSAQHHLKIGFLSITVLPQSFHSTSIQWKNIYEIELWEELDYKLNLTFNGQHCHRGNQQILATDKRHSHWEKAIKAPTWKMEKITPWFTVWARATPLWKTSLSKYFRE